MVTPQAIIQYYEQCRADYEWLWMDRRNLAMHYGYWDDQVRSHSQSLLRLNEVLAERAEVTSGDVVFDAGCGVGGSSLWLAAERGAKVVGISLSARQVTEANTHAARRRLADRATFEVRDFFATGLPDDSFSVVWAIESVCHGTDKAAFFREAYRLLRPGGRLIMSDFFRAGPYSSDKQERIYREWLDGWAVPDLLTRSECGEMAADTGFKEVMLTDATQHIEHSARRLYRLSLPRLPIGRLLLALGVRSPVQHGNTIAARNQYLALQAGLWEYVIVLARKQVSRPASARSLSPKPWLEP